LSGAFLGTMMRTLIALMCRKEFDVRSYDLSGAFLVTDFAREVYVKLPEEAGKYAGKIVRCMKTLYGLITSSRDFVNSLSESIQIQYLIFLQVLLEI